MLRSHVGPAASSLSLSRSLSHSLYLSRSQSIFGDGISLTESAQRFISILLARQSMHNDRYCDGRCAMAIQTLLVLVLVRGDGRCAVNDYFVYQVSITSFIEPCSVN